VARTGVFGGSFDPPHFGHLIVAQDAAEHLQLDRVLMVPAAQPPHKVGCDLAPTESRVNMLEAAVAGHSRFEVSRIEVERGGLSYTVDTLRALRDQRPEDELVLLIGADQLRALSSWRSPLEMADLARIVVMARAGMDPSEAGASAGVPFETVSVTRVDISSTEIRRRIAAGRSVRYWVPEGVRNIIEAELLYTGPKGGKSEGIC
jgi:nicotinate-nucleotide adenylyltransferase